MPRHQRNPQLATLCRATRRSHKCTTLCRATRGIEEGAVTPTQTGQYLTDSQRNRQIKIKILCMRYSSFPMRLYDSYDSILNKEAPGTFQTLVPSSCTKNFCHGWTALFGLGLQIVQVSRSHSDTPLSVELFCTSGQLVAETSA